MLREYIVDGKSGTDWVQYQPKQHREGEQRWVRVVIGDIEDGPETTNSFMPNVLVRPHFHRGSQFQICVQGTAKFPNGMVETLGVHYTDHLTPYGPFQRSPDNSMMVLHAKPAGIVNMDDPEARTLMNRQGRDLIGMPSAAPWTPLPGVPGARHKLLLNEPTGLKAELIEAPAAAVIPVGPAPYGRFEIVIHGSITVHGRLIELGPPCPASPELLGRNLRFVTGDERPSPIHVGLEGATLMCLQYDADAARSYGGKNSERIAQMAVETKQAWAKQA